jgi:hypothetical protein
LTTRIECSQTHLKPISRSRPTPEGKTGITLRVSPTQPQILAGKRADTTWGSNVFSLRHRPDLPKQYRPARYRLGRTPQAARQLTGPYGILSRCQLPRPNCQRTKQADRNGIAAPQMETTPPRSAHDLLRHHCHGQRFDSVGQPKGHTIRNGPQPMISVLNPITTTAASDCLAGSGLTINRTRQQQGSGDHEPFGGNRCETNLRSTLRKLALSHRPHD